MTCPIPDTGNPVLDAFVDAIRITFGKEPFEEIEGFLARAWAQCRIDGDPEWPDVREHVRDAWVSPRTAPP